VSEAQSFDLQQRSWHRRGPQESEVDVGCVCDSVQATSGSDTPPENALASRSAALTLYSK
jgi:hypothetical protein